MPKWMTTIDKTSPVAALGLAAALSGAMLKDWMSQHDAVIMTVLCVIIAAKLIGYAISGLTA